jgi:putative thioredoxin
MSESRYVLDADAASFQSLVIDASHRVPVLVDFWAEWCGPCHALAPILAKLADEYQGRFQVVKIDTDREQALAQQFGIRSLPTVKLFKHGTVVDEFFGAQPEPSVRALLERYVSRASDDARGQASALRERGELAKARALLEQAHVEDPENHRVIADLANVLIDLGELEQARKALDLLPDSVKFEPEVRAISARLEFALVAAAAPPVEALTRTIEQDPRDCESRYRLSALRMAAGEYEAALDLLLEILRLDRSFRDDGARKALLSAFEMLGNEHPLVGRYRAKMSSLLY